MLRRKETKAEYTRLVSTAKSKGNERLNLLIQTICGTGIRVSELQFITVEAVQKGKATISLKGKTRTIFIVKDLQKNLLRYITEQKTKDGAVSITRTGRPMSRFTNSLCQSKQGISPQSPSPIRSNLLRH